MSTPSFNFDSFSEVADCKRDESTCRVPCCIFGRRQTKCCSKRCEYITYVYSTTLDVELRHIIDVGVFEPADQERDMTSVLLNFGNVLLSYHGMRRSEKHHMAIE